MQSKIQSPPPVVTELHCSLRGKNSTRILRAVKGDTARMLRIYLDQGGESYEIPGDCYGVVMGKKPDGTALYNGARIAGGALEYDFTPQTCSCEGLVYLQVRLYGPDRRMLTTLPIRLEVYPTAYAAGEALRSQDEQTALDQLVNDTRGLQLDLQRDLQEGRLQGKSAYDLARDQGYTGTEEQWVRSLAYDHSEEFTALAGQVRTNADLASQKAARAETSRKRAESHELAANFHADRAEQAEDGAMDWARKSEKALAGKQNRIPIQAQTGVSARLKPWIYETFGTVDRLDLTLEPEKGGYLGAYFFRFTAAPGFTALTLPETVLWAGDHRVEPGRLYQVVILENVARMTAI